MVKNAKSVRIFLIVCLASTVLVAGFALSRNQTISSGSNTLPDLCPGEERPPIEKLYATISRSDATISVEHAAFGFHFIFPEKEFSMEENTLQEHEEPITYPNYRYTLLLQSSRQNAASGAPETIIRFVVYPTYCHSALSWQRFLVDQGWRIGTDSITNGRFTMVEKTQGGRIHRRYFKHFGKWHYEFEVSEDATVSIPSENGLAQSVLETFVLQEE